MKHLLSTFNVQTLPIFISITACRLVDFTLMGILNTRFSLGTLEEEDRRRRLPTPAHASPGDKRTIQLQV